MIHENYSGLNILKMTRLGEFNTRLNTFTFLEESVTKGYICLFSDRLFFELCLVWDFNRFYHLSY